MSYPTTVEQDAKVQGQADGATAAPEEHHRERGLLLVGLFKLSKAIFFGAVGAGALQLVHRNVGDVLMRMIETLRIDQEGKLASFLMDRADLVGGHQLRRASLFAFTYAVLCLVEGVGLVTEQGWAEYFTVTLTAAALPWETYELIDRFQPYKIGLLLVNVAVLVYLLWFLKRKQRRDALAKVNAE
jgi:uncharacterized membrane protein (DUF2068 family)